MRFVPAVLLSAILLAQSASSLQYTSDSKMVLPKDYREWIFLTAGLGMSYAPGAKDSANPVFDNVFADPVSYRAFQKSGTWPDKTMLILELRASDNHTSITTSGRSQQPTIGGIEAHVKDSARGGWAFYAFGTGSTGTLLAKTEACYSCHEQNGAVDTTFAQYYPTLIDAAKAKGTFKTTGH